MSVVVALRELSHHLVRILHLSNHLQLHFHLHLVFLHLLGKLLQLTVRLEVAASDKSIDEGCQHADEVDCQGPARTAQGRRLGADHVCVAVEIVETTAAL